MKISTFTQIAVLLMLVPGIATASEGSTPIYRVEVIVLAHLDGQPDRYRVEQTGNYSNLTDPLLNARRIAWTGPDVEDHEFERNDFESDELESDEPDNDARPVQIYYPLTYINLDGLGPEMQGAWQRLENSARHQALTWRAWHQPLSRQHSSEPVRIHDEHSLWINSLELEQLLGRPNRQDSDEQALGLVTTLMPQVTHRLDGSFRIHQRQFTHAEIDLVWHEPIETRTGPLTPEHLPQGAFEIHRINQSRTVRPQRLEYFDSGWLGVLVWIEPWESPVPIASPGGQRAQED